MSKDFKLAPSSENPFSQYGMSWMLGGVAVGLLAGLVMYGLSDKGAKTPPLPAATDAQTNVVPGIPANASLQDTPAAAGNTGQAPPSFNYHAVLPQLEMDVPMAIQHEQPPAPTSSPQKPAKPSAEAASVAPKTEASKPPASAVTPPVAAAPATTKKLGGGNGFQLGSYQSQAQAASLQARLSRGGLNTRIEQGSVNGQVWFRVRIGPAANPEMLGKWKQTLSGMGISPMLIRM